MSESRNCGLMGERRTVERIIPIVFSFVPRPKLDQVQVNFSFPYLTCFLTSPVKGCPVVFIFHPPLNFDTLKDHLIAAPLAVTECHLLLHATTVVSLISWRLRRL